MENITKEEHYKKIAEQIKKTKQEAITFAENNFAIGCSEFSDGYNTALIHFMEYLKK